MGHRCSLAKLLAHVGALVRIVACRWYVVVFLSSACQLVHFIVSVTCDDRFKPRRGLGVVSSISSHRCAWLGQDEEHVCAVVLSSGCSDSASTAGSLPRCAELAAVSRFAPTLGQCNHVCLPRCVEFGCVGMLLAWVCDLASFTVSRSVAPLLGRCCLWTSSDTLMVQVAGFSGFR